MRGNQRLLRAACAVPLHRLRTVAGAYRARLPAPQNQELDSALEAALATIERVLAPLAAAAADAQK